MRRPGVIVLGVLLAALNACGCRSRALPGEDGGTAGSAAGGRGGSGRGGTGGGPGGSVGGGGGVVGGTTGGAVGGSGGAVGGTTGGAVGASGGVGGAGGTGGSTGSGGAAGSATDGGAGAGGGGALDPADLISDFEDVAAATVVMAGTPPRNGIWYVNDNPALSCVQMPRPAWQTQAVGLPPERYIGVEPPGGVHAGSTGSRALRGWWTGCTIGAAGIGADFNLPMVPDGGIYMGPKVPYDVTPYKGVTFWARAAIGSDTALRIKFPMVDETKVEDGGHCSESALSKCGDSFGTKFTTPVDGSWKQFTVRWTDATFSQEGWGKPFTWRPEAVTSIQIVPVYADQTYDFYVDDISFIH